MLLYENAQYRESANFINRLSGNTFGVIVHDLPVDVFIDSMPQSLPIIESLYAKVTSPLVTIDICVWIDRFGKPLALPERSSLRQKVHSVVAYRCSRRFRNCTVRSLALVELQGRWPSTERGTPSPLRLASGERRRRQANAVRAERNETEKRHSTNKTNRLTPKKKEGKFRPLFLSTSLH